MVHDITRSLELLVIDPPELSKSRQASHNLRPSLTDERSLVSGRSDLPINLMPDAPRKWRPALGTLQGAIRP